MPPYQWSWTKLAVPKWHVKPFNSKNKSSPGSCKVWGQMSGLFLASVSRLSTESASSRLSGEIGLEAHDEFSCSIIPLIKNGICLCYLESNLCQLKTDRFVMWLAEWHCKLLDDRMFDHRHRENKGNHKDAVKYIELFTTSRSQTWTRLGHMLYGFRMTSKLFILLNWFVLWIMIYAQNIISVTRWLPHLLRNLSLAHWIVFCIRSV